MPRNVIQLDEMRRGRPSGPPPEPSFPAPGPRSPGPQSPGPRLAAPELHDPAPVQADPLLTALDGTVRAGDRVLLIGGGLGVAATLAARAARGGRLIVAEPNLLLISRLDAVLAFNGVTNAETINALLAVGMRGCVEFNPESDPRTPLRSEGHPPHPTCMVPFMDLNVILAEERINVLLCDTPVAPAALLAQADLAGVDRILVHRGSDAAQCWGSAGICRLLAGQGYDAEPHGAAIRFTRQALAQRSANRA